MGDNNGENDQNQTNTKGPNQLDRVDPQYPQYPFRNCFLWTPSLIMTQCGCRNGGNQSVSPYQDWAVQPYGWNGASFTFAQRDILGRNVLTADGDYKNEVGVCCQTHSSNIDAMNTLQLDWSDVSLPAHCWTNALVGNNWKQWKYQWLKIKTLKWLGSYHSINMASLVSESWFCKLLCSIFILGHLKKHGLTLDNFV